MARSVLQSCVGAGAWTGHSPGNGMGQAGNEGETSLMNSVISNQLEAHAQGSTGATESFYHEIESCYYETQSFYDETYSFYDETWSFYREAWSFFYGT